jgi:hypothetical protein
MNCICTYKSGIKCKNVAAYPLKNSRVCNMPPHIQKYNQKIIYGGSSNQPALVAQSVQPALVAQSVQSAQSVQPALVAQSVQSAQSPPVAPVQQATVIDSKQREDEVTYLDNSMYAQFTEQGIEAAETGAISFEDFKDHPRGSIGVRYAEQKMRYYDVDTLKKMIDLGQADPFTRQPFSVQLKERVKFYNTCHVSYPDHKSVDKNDLFNKWMDTFDPQSILTLQEKNVIRNKAHCFLTLDDFNTVFKNYDVEAIKIENNLDEKAARLMIRKRAIDDLKNSKVGSWLIRPSSIIHKYTKVDEDGKEVTLFTKVLVLTYKTDVGIKHILIVHRQGVGYFIMSSVKRAMDPNILIKQVDNYIQGINQDNLNYYPSFLMLLEALNKGKTFLIFGNRTNIKTLHSRYGADDLSG